MDKFWLNKEMDELTVSEWESLCDNCGLCCTIRLEDEDTAEIVATNICCKYLDQDTCKCTDYKNRQKNVPDCLRITPDNISENLWLPDSCGYKLAYYKQDLPNWHPLISGDPKTVHRAGISLRGNLISEDDIEGDVQDYIID